MTKIVRKHTDDEGLLFYDFVVEKEASGLSKKSIKNYKEVYSLFVKEVGQKISKKTISNWIHQMIDSGKNPISINYYICQIRVFAYWLIKKGYCENFEIKKIKTQEPQLKTISDEDINVLLEKPALKCSFSEYRSWVIINFILGTGARASTVMNTKVEDVDFSSKEIRYTHLKNKKSAIVPLSNSLERVLKTYLNSWEIGNGYLFPEIHGGKLTLSGLEQAIRKFVKSRGIKYKGVHAFRHTFAKKYVVNGGNVFSLQRLLTHTDLTMTKKYVHLFSSDLKIGYDDICPLDSYHKSSVLIKRKSNWNTIYS